MSEIGGEIPQVIEGDPKIKDVYRDPQFVSLYRFENPTIPYEESREGIVSRKQLIGNWYTDNLNDLAKYTRTRIKGQRGGRYIVVRVPKDSLALYDATTLPETRDMDIEKGNYIVPDDVSKETRVEIDALFKDGWEGRINVPFSDWKEIDQDIQSKLTDEAILTLLEPRK